MGAYVFIQKPVTWMNCVSLSTGPVIFSAEAENKRLQGELKGRAGEYAGIIGQCPEMQHVFATIRKVAASDVAF